MPDVIDVLEGAARLHHHVGGHDFEVDAGGFWQVHPGAAPALVGAILSGLRPQPGDVVLDLYAGAGLFAVLIGEAVAGAGRVVAVEGSQQAAADARSNLRSVGAAPGRRLARPGVGRDHYALASCWRRIRIWSCSTRLGPVPAPM